MKRSLLSTVRPEILRCIGVHPASVVHLLTEPECGGEFGWLSHWSDMRLYIILILGQAHVGSNLFSELTKNVSIVLSMKWSRWSTDIQRLLALWVWLTKTSLNLFLTVGSLS